MNRQTITLAEKARVVASAYHYSDGKGIRCSFCKRWLHSSEGYGDENAVWKKLGEHVAKKHPEKHEEVERLYEYGFDRRR